MGCLLRRDRLILGHRLARFRTAEMVVLNWGRLGRRPFLWAQVRTVDWRVVGLGNGRREGHGFKTLAALGRLLAEILLFLFLARRWLRRLLALFIAAGPSLVGQDARCFGWRDWFQIFAHASLPLKPFR